MLSKYYGNYSTIYLFYITVFLTLITLSYFHISIICFLYKNSSDNRFFIIFSTSFLLLNSFKCKIYWNVQTIWTNHFWFRIYKYLKSYYSFTERYKQFITKLFFVIIFKSSLQSFGFSTSFFYSQTWLLQLVFLTSNYCYNHVLLFQNSDAKDFTWIKLLRDYI